MGEQMNWTELPIDVQLSFHFDSSWTPGKLNDIKSAIAALYDQIKGDLLGIELFYYSMSPTNQVTLSYRPGSLESFPDERLTRIDTASLSPGKGFLNSQGFYVPLTANRLLYHELVHSAMGLDDNGWVLNGNPQWDQLYDPTIDLKGATVEKENIYAATFANPGENVIRPSYLSAGSEQDLNNGGHSFTEEVDGTIVTVDNVAVDLGAFGSAIDFIEYGNSKELVLGLDSNDSINGAGGDDFLYGGSGDDVVIGGQGSDYIYGDSGTSNPIHAGDDVLIDGGGSFYDGQGHNLAFNDSAQIYINLA